MPAVETWIPTAVGLLVAGMVLLVGSGLRRRLDALAESLERLDQLEALSTRLEDVADAVEERQLAGRLQAKFTELGEELARLTSAVAELQQVRQQEAVPAAPVPEDLGTVVRHHLSGQGFERIQILTNVTELAGYSGRVAFEASRRGVTHKGHVSVREGVVVEDKVHASYSAFP